MKVATKVGVAAFTTFFANMIIGWAILPVAIKMTIKNMVSLKKGNDIRDMYLKVPFPLEFKIYIFNVTNPVEITEHGAKPIIKEVGPYWYDEWKEKVDVEENEFEDTLLYTIKNTFIFNSKLSAPLTGNEVVTIPHPLIAAVVMAVLKEKPAAIPVLNKAIASIHRNPTTPFLTDTVENILFAGFDILCNVTDFAGKAVCSQLKTEAQGIVEVEPGIYKLSLFGPKNGTKGRRVKVKRGIKNIHDLGRVLEFDGEKEMKIWAGKECNTYHGTDSTIFPPFLKENEGLVTFSPEICRSTSATYLEDTKYDGVPVRRYVADFGDSSTIKEEKCYCPAPDKCFKKGIIDLTPCTRIPLIASLPHFYDTHEMYINTVDGLNPNEEDHGIKILFESMTGTPVSAAKRLQFSLPLEPVPKITVMKNLPVTYLPMFWVEEGVHLNKTWTGMLKKQLFLVLKITTIFKYLVLVGSIGGMAVAAYLHFTKRGEATITPVKVESKNEDVAMYGKNGNIEGGRVNQAIKNDVDRY